MSLRDQRTCGSRNPHSPSTKKSGPTGPDFLEAVEKPSGFFDSLSYFFSASTPLRRAATFSSVVAQLAAKRIAEWVSSTRSQYS